MTTTVYALMRRIPDKFCHDDVWLQSIHSSEEAAYAARKERYLVYFRNQMDALNADSSAEIPEEIWYVSSYELR